MGRLRDEVRKHGLVKAYKIMEYKKNSKVPTSPYLWHEPTVGKWYMVDGELEMCLRGFHTIPNLREAMALAELMKDKYCYYTGSRVVVFECLVSVPEKQKHWAPFATEEDGPWAIDEFVTTKQLSRFQKLVRVVYTARGKKYASSEG